MTEASDDEGAVTKETVGERLQRARQIQQLSVTDVANQLRITVTYVNLIERNQFHKLPGTIFARGYLKLYAKLLNLPIDDIVAHYLEQTGDSVIETQRRPAANEYGASMRRNAIKWAVGIIVLVLVLPTLAWWYLHHDDVDIANLAPEEQPAITATVATKEDTDTSARDLTSTNDAAAHAPVELSQPAALLPVSDSTTDANSPAENNNPPLLTVTQAPLTSDTSNTVSAQVKAADTLEISFTQKSWVQIKNIEGITLHDAEHQAGEHITVGGKSPFYVWLKNGKAVTILFNGDPVKIDNLDNKGVARLVVGK